MGFCGVPDACCPLCSGLLCFSVQHCRTEQSTSSLCVPLRQSAPAAHGWAMETWLETFVGETPCHHGGASLPHQPVSVHLYPLGFYSSSNLTVCSVHTPCPQNPFSVPLKTCHQPHSSWCGGGHLAEGSGLPAELTTQASSQVPMVSFLSGRLVPCALSNAGLTHQINGTHGLIFNLFLHFHESNTQL